MGINLSTTLFMRMLAQEQQRAQQARAQEAAMAERAGGDPGVAQRGVEGVLGIQQREAGRQQSLGQEMGQNAAMLGEEQPQLEGAPGQYAQQGYKRGQGAIRASEADRAGKQRVMEMEQGGLDQRAVLSSHTQQATNQVTNERIQREGMANRQNQIKVAQIYAGAQKYAAKLRSEGKPLNFTKEVHAALSKSLDDAAKEMGQAYQLMGGQGALRREKLNRARNAVDMLLVLPPDVQANYMGQLVPSLQDAGIPADAVSRALQMAGGFVAPQNPTPGMSLEISGQSNPNAVPGMEFEDPALLPIPGNAGPSPEAQSELEAFEAWQRGQ